MKSVNELKCGKYLVKLTNQDKIWFPKSNITKGDIVKYYEKISDEMLPFLKDRLISMQRYPNGITHKPFFHKNAPDYFPSFVKRVPLEKSNGEIINHAVINNLASLIYIANYGCLIPHIWLSREDKINYPDRMVFDMDPSVDNFELVRTKTIELKALLEDKLELPVFVMLTGSRGIHLDVPLKRLLIFDEVRAFATEIAEFFVSLDPKNLTMEIRKDKRGKKIFVDILRNSWGATAVAPYAVRAYEKAPVATPIFPEELLDKKLSSQKYNISNVFAKIKADGNPWKKIDKEAVSLTNSQKLFAKLINSLS